MENQGIRSINLNPNCSPMEPETDRKRERGEAEEFEQSKKSHVYKEENVEFSWNKDTLPLELSRYIFSHLDQTSLTEAAKVNHHFREYVGAGWQAIKIRERIDFPWSASAQESIPARADCLISQVVIRYFSKNSVYGAEKQKKEQNLAKLLERFPSLRACRSETACHDLIKDSQGIGECLLAGLFKAEQGSDWMLRDRQKQAKLFEEAYPLLDRAMDSPAIFCTSSLAVKILSHNFMDTQAKMLELAFKAAEQKDYRALETTMILPTLMDEQIYQLYEQGKHYPPILAKVADMHMQSIGKSSCRYESIKKLNDSERLDQAERLMDIVFADENYTPSSKLFDRAIGVKFKKEKWAEVVALDQRSEKIYGNNFLSRESASYAIEARLRLE